METLIIKKKNNGLASEKTNWERNKWERYKIHPILGYRYPSTGAGAPVENNVKLAVQRKAWQSLHI